MITYKTTVSINSILDLDVSDKGTIEFHKAIGTIGIIDSYLEDEAFTHTFDDGIPTEDDIDAFIMNGCDAMVACYLDCGIDDLCYLYEHNMTIDDLDKVLAMNNGEK